MYTKDSHVVKLVILVLDQGALSDFYICSLSEQAYLDELKANLASIEISRLAKVTYPDPSQKVSGY